MDAALEAMNGVKGANRKQLAGTTFFGGCKIHGEQVQRVGG